jgi:ATP-dependent RNA/DNA helicase IGHMBP2
METKHPQIQFFLECLELEAKEQEKRYSLAENQSIKQLKNEGIVLHPLKITRKSFGYADYPEIAFTIPYPMETANFKDGMAIECFSEGEESIKGILLQLDGKRGEFRIFAPDFPDWIEDGSVGIKLTPDQRTFEVMKKGLYALQENTNTKQLFNQIHDKNTIVDNDTNREQEAIKIQNSDLNTSQQKAVIGVLNTNNISILHGPPGTGKTTTLIECIQQLVTKGERILLSAPSNAAVDHLAKNLLHEKLPFLRIGNTTKVAEEIYPHTLEGKISQSNQQKEIKRLRIQSEELRKMANQYKRNFGKAERDQRKLLIQEVKNIRKEIRELKHYYEEKLISEASIIVGTPMGIYDFGIKNEQYDILILDEAGQCIAPLAWTLFPLAKKWVLAGDHLQLPPTVLSDEASMKGFNKSILEYFINKVSHVHFLDTQYRMRKSIAQFSSDYFYEGKLLTPSHLQDEFLHVEFYDTAGAGHEEEKGSNGSSLMNIGEIDVIKKLMELNQTDTSRSAFISPYSAQITLAKNELPQKLRIATIDSFQGQEQETIFISLVRSNSEGIIGFLTDYRRMNVALTRAKTKLYVIGDSSTIGTDKFFAQFLEYVEKINGYKSCWELM